MFDDKSHVADVSALQLGDKRAQLSIGGRSFQNHLPDRRQTFKHRTHHCREHAEIPVRIRLGVDFRHAYALRRRHRLICARERGLNQVPNEAGLAALPPMER